ncbi:MAG: 3-oxoacyl-ACP reductase FabG [Candidatus Margulisbacteria bacterium]|jgi:3-oxoacyl-[acyl-carrier protein] reductase|nr:3-oxoacyl-ACP reductase FabG [Candidatus Margulisiibacteriota bacterium]
MPDASQQVLITGAGRGIGAAIARRLARDGYELVLHCHKSRGQTEALAGEIKAARILQFDVTDRQAARETITADIEKFGAYYGVVINAGISADVPFPGMADEDWDKVLNTSLNGFYNVVRPAIMPMISARRPGRIVTISSVSGLLGNRGQVNYSAAKAGLIGATRALALELARHKITVNSVAPGFIETDMTKNVDFELAKKFIPMARPGQADDVAHAVSFLLSAGAVYITKQVLGVNGGMC